MQSDGIIDASNSSNPYLCPYKLQLINLSSQCSESGGCPISHPHYGQILTYIQLFTILLQYHPQIISPSQVSLMYYSQQSTRWLFVTRQFKHIFSEDGEELKISYQILLDMDNDNHMIGRVHNHESLLNFKHGSASVCRGTYEEIKLQINSVLDSAELYWEDVRKVIMEPFDIHLFWASPYFTEDNYQRKPLQKYKRQSQDNLRDPKQTVLRYSVKYTNYIEAIIKALRVSRKSIHLSIDNFSTESFKKKNKKKFSIVYLVCHTEVAQEEDQDDDIVLPTNTKKKYSKKSNQSVKEEMQEDHDENTSNQKFILSGIDLTQSFQIIVQPPSKSQTSQNSEILMKKSSEKKTPNTSEIKRQDSRQEQVPDGMRKNQTEDVSDAYLPAYRNKAQSTYSEKGVSKEQAHNKSHRKNKKQSASLRKPRYTQYFVGQDSTGKLVHITPQKLQEMLMLKQIQIQLLILHTSYPFFHTEIFRRHAHNIILINSNTLIPDQSVSFFLNKYFQHLLQCRSISKAYFKTVSQIQIKYPDVQCCCYHQHSANCSSNYNMKPSKFDGYHYKYHIDRCHCPDRASLRHKCTQKWKLAQRDYRMSKMRENNLLGVIKKGQDTDREYRHTDHQHSKSQDIDTITGQKKQQHYRKEQPILQKINSEMSEQFFFCCCKTQQHLQHSFRMKFYDFHMPLPSTLTLEPTLNQHTDFQIQPGQLNDNGDWLNSFCRQPTMVGNQEVMMAMLNMFVPEQINTNTNLNSSMKNSTTFEYMRVFNLFGLPMTGKQYIAVYFANLLIRKCKHRFERWEKRQFQDVREIKDLEERVFYIFQHKNHKIPLFRRKLKIQKKSGQNSLPYKINAIIITWYKVETDLQDIVAMESQPFDYEEECGYYIKMGQNFSQQLKDKLKTYLKLTLRRDQKYYPRSFEKDQIILALKMSKYDKNDLYQAFLSQCKTILITDLLLVGSAVRFSSKSSQQLLRQIQKLRVKSKQSSLLTYENIKQFFPLVYQKYAKQIAKECLTIMRMYVIKTEVKDPYLRFFEATTINPRSYISTHLRQTISSLQRVECPDLGPPFKEVIREIALEFFRNTLCLHTVFSYLSDEQRKELAMLGILLVNNIIVWQKNRKYLDINFEMKSSLSIDMSGMDVSLSLQEEEDTQLVNLQSLSLTSRKGLVYLLDKIMAHIPFETSSRHHLKIICEQLKVQLYFEAKYESEKLDQTFNQQIQKSIFRIVSRNQKITRRDANLTNVLQLDFVLALTLFYTNCGRQPLTKHAESMIRKSRRQGSSISRLTRTVSTSEPQPQYQTPRSKLLLKMCSDRNLYNRIINNLSQNREEEGNFQQLTYYEDILSKWDILSKCQPQSNPLQAYHILQNMKKQIILSDKKRSHYLECLFYDLQKKIEEKFNLLNKKLFVWMQANPVPNKKSETVLEARTLIQNTVIEEFNKQSQKKRKMLAIKIKLNSQNLNKLEEIRGCRFLCLDINLNNNDQTQVIGQNSHSELEIVPQKKLVEVLQRIPIINLFICLRKPSIIIKKLKQLSTFKKDLVYFNFNAHSAFAADYPPKTVYIYEKMIMMEVIKNIVYKMHFQRDSITDAFEKTINGLEFKDQKGNYIVKNKDLQKITFLHFYQHYYEIPVTDHDFPVKTIKLSMQNVFEAHELQKVQQITRICFPIQPQGVPSHSKSSHSRSHSSQSSPIPFNFNDNKIDIKITFTWQRLLYALIQYLKLKQNFHNHIIINVEDCYSNPASNDYGLFKTMKNQKILDLYYTTKKGILIFVDTQLLEDKGWEKEEFDRLFTQPESDDPNSSSTAIRSVKVRIFSTIKNKKHSTDVLICFFDRIS